MVAAAAAMEPKSDSGDSSGRDLEFFGNLRVRQALMQKFSDLETLGESVNFLGS